MLKKKTIVTALIFTGMTFVPAAMAAHGGHGAGPSVRGSGASAARVYGWRSGGGARHAFHRHGRGVGVYAYDGDYGYGGCGYLYSRAVATGSSYWWNRYEACEG